MKTDSKDQQQDKTPGSLGLDSFVRQLVEQQTTGNRFPFFFSYINLKCITFAIEENVSIYKINKSITREIFQKKKSEEVARLFVIVISQLFEFLFRSFQFIAKYLLPSYYIHYEQYNV